MLNYHIGCENKLVKSFQICLHFPVNKISELYHSINAIIKFNIKFNKQLILCNLNMTCMV